MCGCEWTVQPIPQKILVIAFGQPDHLRPCQLDGAGAHLTKVNWGRVGTGGDDENEKISSPPFPKYVQKDLGIQLVLKDFMHGGPSDLINLMVRGPM